MDDEKRVQKVIQILDSTYPDAPKTYLRWDNPYQLTIATILSAHTADACVNKITPKLFERYPTPKDLMNASKNDVIELIRPCGTYNRKSEYIISSAKTIVEEFNGEIPRNMTDLVKLKGVSRKTANVVLSVAFDIQEGIVVDTHVKRVSQRLGFTQEKYPKKIEQDLMDLIAKNQWYEYARLMGAHGRQTCHARSPDCKNCTVNHLCPSAKIQ
ncbi:MAG: Endonuclease III [Candidatus Thorarchaeota archaeon]|nr:MAG: Endonuclease III [Candidatus Thorarchaeota archaeon]